MIERHYSIWYVLQTPDGRVFGDDDEEYKFITAKEAAEYRDKRKGLRKFSVVKVVETREVVDEPAK